MVHRLQKVVCLFKQACFNMFIICSLWFSLGLLNYQENPNIVITPNNIPKGDTHTPKNRTQILKPSVTFNHAQTDHINIQYFPETYVKDDPNKRACISLHHTDPGLRMVGYGHTITDHCSGSLCQLNENHEPPLVHQAIDLNCLHNVTKCLTVIVKTRNRMIYVQTFIMSLRKFYPYLRVIIIDEAFIEMNATNSAILRNAIAKDYPLVTYVRTNPGMGHGRNIGLKLVTTKYFLTCDDDFVFLKETNLTKLVEVLESADISIAGGTAADHFPYDGVFRVYQNSSDQLPELIMYPHAFYEPLPCFSRCYVADIIKNFFIGKTFDVLQAGGWDSSRLFYEHEDFFLRMRNSGLKIVLCRDVIFRHWMRNRDLADRRFQYYQIWHDHLLQKWQMRDMYFCKRKFYVTSEKCPKKIDFLHS